MLKVLRNKKTAKKIWLGLAIIIVPAFTLWGFGGAFRSREENAPVGKLFGRTVTAEQFKDALDAVRTQAVLQFGDRFAQMQQHINFEQEAINRLIMLHEAKLRKIKVSDEEVIKKIQNYAYFRSRNGFDRKNYEQILQYGLHMQPRIFEEQIRQNLIIAKLYEDATSKVSLTDEQIKEEYRKQNKKISVYYLAAILADLAKEINPSENELIEYYKKNREQFKEGPFLNIDYLVLDDLQNAKAAASMLKKGGLEKIARQYGAQVKETGLFQETDPIPGLGWSPVMAEMLSGLKAGQFAEPLVMDNKYYFMRLKERKEAFIPEFEKIKDKVKEEMIKVKSSQAAKQRINDAAEEIKQQPSKGGFDAIAKKTGLKASVTGLFQLNSYIEDIGASNKLWLEADKLKPEQTSPVIEMPPGYYLIRLKTAVEPDEKKFTAEKDDFAAKLLERKKQEEFDKLLESLRRKAQ